MACEGALRQLEEGRNSVLVVVLGSSPDSGSRPTVFLENKR